MDLGKALAQISEINGVLSRAEVYRGYRPRTMAITGVLACSAALFQPHYLPQLSAASFDVFWLSMAVACLVLVGGEMAVDYAYSFSPTQRRMARKVVAQFSPSLAAGGVLPLILTSQTGLLPGLWSLSFSLGIFGARPYLPRGIGWVGLFYMLAGLLLLTPGGTTLGALGMGGAFGFGQLFMALVLYWNLERKPENV